ncbi:MAG: hypothetical protein AAGH15_23440 [Myxococcota bacterium]
MATRVTAAACFVRASQMKANVRAFAELDPDAERSVRERLGSLVDEIAEAVSVAWMPLEADLRLSGAIAEVAGEAALRRVAQGSVVRSAEGTLLGPFHRALLALGLTPATALSRAPYAWPLLYKSCGKIRVDASGPEGVTLTHLGVPEAMRAPATYLDGIAGGFEGAIRVGGGEAPRVEVTRDGDEVRYRCRWT